ncbi:helix-turn-helix domain-containing protein [Paenibacillus xylaniclasticus]|uniref:helix-turn-helix domain-containing protein n=1 Tax=Paenibacillus xylaniclasticus TaxID=588083 RepID=UPI000FDB5AE5|nr:MULTISPECIES: helix-turn-helix transcriptional regulator [Paenibacillus]GFN32566.1 hypothetical protein PCURB6_28260 [Paenibacillus curdlanolyticus]
MTASFYILFIINITRKVDQVVLKGRELMIMRIKKKIKGQDLAKILEVSQSYISKLENEKQEIPIHIYKKWVSILDGKDEELIN